MKTDLSLFLAGKKNQEQPNPVPKEQKRETTSLKLPSKPKKQSLADFLKFGKEIETDKTISVKGLGIRKRNLERGEKQVSKALEDAEKAKTLWPKVIVPHTESSDILAALAKQASKQQTYAPPIQPPLIPLKDHGPKKIIFDESQLSALAGLEKEQFGCLIGAAGTGKTTVTNELIKRIEKYVDTIHIGKTTKYGEYNKEVFNVAIAFCAFTGRAVQQIKRMIPEEYHSNAMTLHKLLGFHPEWFTVDDKDNPGEQKDVMKFVPYFDEANKLPYQVIIIDEAGMVPIPLWNQLWAACENTTKIIFIGDINQLPPVQGRSVLGWAMLKWPVFELTTIHRQAQDNPIITNAHKILKGHFPQPYPKQFDIVSVDDGSLAAKNKLYGAVQKLHKADQFNEMDDAIIVPQNKGPLGQPMLNEKFVEYFNPQKRINGVIVNPRIRIVGGFTSFHIATGDKMMLLQNDNDLGLTNGMCGVILNITTNEKFSASRSRFASSVSGADKHVELHMDENDLADLMTGTDPEDEEEDDQTAEEKEKNQRQASHITTIRFETGMEVDFSSAGEYQKLAHAYAFTCHKSQGGEYPTVFILCHSANHRLLSREWLYTAVTRAQNRVVLLCNNRGLAKALNRQNIKGKTLAEKVASFRALEDQKDTYKPNLPEPRKLDYARVKLTFKDWSRRQATKFGSIR